jgi:uncharacterized membrane protein
MTSDFLEPNSRPQRGNYAYDGIMNLKIDVRNFLAFEFLALIAMKILSDFGVIPQAFYYVFDFINFFLIILSLNRISSERGLGRYTLFPVLALAVFFAVSAVINLVDPGCAFWEFFIDFRLFGVMILVCLVWDYDIWWSFIDLLYKLQWLNALLAGFEFFALGLIQDNIGGMFGMVAGCNGPLNVYLCLVCSYAISQYVALGRRGKVSLVSLLLTCICSIAIAAIAEIKFFYFELVVLAILLVLFNRPTKRTIGIVAIICAAIVIGMYIFSILMPSQFAEMIDLDALLAEADNSNVSTGYGVSRINAISQLDALFFHGDSMLALLGMGFGSATPGMGSGLLVSRFYEAYGFLKYDYLQLPTFFLQVGFVGMILYMTAVVSPVVQGFRDRKYIEPSVRWVLGLGLTFSVLFFVNCFYMSTMRTQFAFLWALALIGPYLAQRDCSFWGRD